MTGFDLVAIAIAAVVAIALPLGLRPLLHRLRVFDVPNARSSHDTPTLRGGGIAQLVALACAVPVLLMHDREPVVIAVVVGAAAGILGLVDDIRSLSVRVRLPLLLVIALAAGWLLSTMFDFAWGWAALIAVLVVGYINAVNFMDGVNGISSLHGVVVGAGFIAMGLFGETDWLVVGGALLLVAYLAFLPWNLAGAGMFLGDVGSYLLGALIATLAGAAVAAGIPLIAVVAPVSIYLADTALTLLRRLIRRERIWEAHRTHLYQRMAAAGWSHLGVAGWVSMFSALAGAVGLLALLPSWWPVALIGVTIVVVAYVVLTAKLGSSRKAER